MLSFTRRQSFGFVRIENICRPQFHCGSKDAISLWRDRKHCGKKRKCWLPAFSSFSPVFSKAFYLGHLKLPLCGQGVCLIVKKSLAACFPNSITFLNMQVKSTLSSDSYKSFSKALFDYKKTEELEKVCEVLADLFTENESRKHLFASKYLLMDSFYLLLSITTPFWTVVSQRNRCFENIVGK